MQQGLDFLKTVVKKAAQPEVLMLDNWGSEGTWETELCIYALFLRIFKPELEIHNYCL